MKMLFSTDANGWPVRLISETHEGPAPAGHVVFDDLRAVVAWQESHPELKPLEVAAPLPVPDEVASWALREITTDRGHKDAIAEKLASLPEPTRTKATDRWHSKPTISRASVYIVAMQKLLGWSDEYVDDLFRDAYILSQK